MTAHDHHKRAGITYAPDCPDCQAAARAEKRAKEKAAAREAAVKHRRKRKRKRKPRARKPRVRKPRVVVVNRRALFLVGRDCWMMKDGLVKRRARRRNSKGHI